MIARVFPRKTAMSPTDALAFFGQPTIENIADCIKAGVTEVHISVTFYVGSRKGRRSVLRMADPRRSGGGRRPGV